MDINKKLSFLKFIYLTKIFKQYCSNIKYQFAINIKSFIT